VTTYQTVEFVSRWTAEARPAQDDTIVISINNSWDDFANLQPGWKDVLALKFDDVDFLSDRYKRFYLGDATEILAFVRKYQDSATRILVHCMAGESRSAAVAKVIAGMYDLPFPANYEKANEWVLSVMERTRYRETRAKALQA